MSPATYAQTCAACHALQFDKRLADAVPHDKPEVIRHRIEVYNQETHPLLDYYRQQGKLVTVQGVGTMDEIFKRIVAVL